MGEPTTELYSYRIDEHDRVVDLSGNWFLFAQANQAGDRCHPDQVLGRSIWDFMAGQETCHLYELVFHKVRVSSKPVSINFRCDAPDRQRFCQLAIVSVAAGALALFSKVLRTESRDPVRLLALNEPRSSEFMRICSVCKRVALRDDRWVEVELAIAEMKLFDAPTLPQITHVTCPDCFRTIMGELDKMQ